MVEPEREIPGRVAQSWAAPMARESAGDMLRAVLIPWGARSAAVRARAVMRKHTPSATMLSSVEKPLIQSWRGSTARRGTQESIRK